MNTIRSFSKIHIPDGSYIGYVQSDGFSIRIMFVGSFCEFRIEKPIHHRHTCLVEVKNNIAYISHE